MTNPAVDDLSEAIHAFKSAEATLVRLSEQTETVAGAGERLEEARAALSDIRDASTDLLQHHVELVRQLTAISTQLIDATELVRRNDPARVFEAIDRLGADFERQKDRVSEMTGELRARVDESTRSIQAAVDDQRAQLDRTADARAQQLVRRLWWPAVAAALLAATAVALQIVTMATS